MAEFDYNQLIAPGIGAGAAFLGSIPQMVEARRLRKERERLLAEGAPGLTPIEQQQLAEARSRAASTLAPGYGQEMEGIAQQQADVLAAGKRGSQTSSNLLNLLSRMNAQGQAARRNLAMRGAQAQRAAQGELTNLSMSADARRENRMRRYEDDLSAMDAARRQYNAAAGMAPLQGALAFMPVEGFKFGATKPEIDVPEQMETKTPPDFVFRGLGGIPQRLTTPANPAPKLTPTLETMNKPFLNATYKNMFDPNAAARRIQMTENAEAKRAGMIQTRMPKFNSGVQIPQGVPKPISTIPDVTQQGFYSNPYSKFGGDNSRFTYNPDGTVEVVGSKGQRSKGNYKVDRNGRPQIFNLD